MAQETDKTWVPQVMVKQETLQEIMGETLDPTEMVKNQEWDLDQVNYDFYQNSFKNQNVYDNVDLRVIVKQEERPNELFLKKKQK